MDLIYREFMLQNIYLPRAIHGLKANSLIL